MRATIPSLPTIPSVPELGMDVVILIQLGSVNNVGGTDISPGDGDVLVTWDLPVPPGAPVGLLVQLLLSPGMGLFAQTTRPSNSTTAGFSIVTPDNYIARVINLGDGITYSNSDPVDSPQFSVA